MSRQTPIAVTPGEPGGIGPDILLAVAAGSLPRAILAICDREMLAERARILGLPVKLVDPPAELAAHEPGVLPVEHLPLAVGTTPGRPDPANARAILAVLESAARGCLDGRLAALVTGPIQKSSINEGGVHFPGHTEYLASLTRGGSPVMMLVADGLRVALVTTHLPLRKVPDAITPQRLDTVLGVLGEELTSRFDIRSPRIAVCGLNPHAGEGGHLGREEDAIIAPAVERARRRYDVTGPLPADTVFTRERLKDFDAVLAMYHDQGLPVLKHAGFGRSVNVTLGLPIIRTSVDHGTALDLAGSGRANPGSLAAAIALAAGLAAAPRR